MKYKLGWKQPNAKRYKMTKLIYSEGEMIGTAAAMKGRGLDIKIIPQNKKGWELRGL